MLKKITHHISVAALFLVPIFALIVANGYFFPFITGKAFYFRILVEVAFASWIILAFLDPRYRPKMTSLTVGVTIFAVIALIADLLGVNPIRSLWSNFERMEGWIVVIHLWAFYMVAVNIFGAGEEGKRLWHRWFNFSLVIATVIALYGVGQLLHIFAIHQSGTRLDATLGNSAYMAVYMIFHAFLAAYFYFTKIGKPGSAFMKWTYAILAVLFSFIIFETQTRGSILGLIGGILLALALYAIFARGQETKKWRWISTGVIALVIILGVVFWLSRSTPFIKNSEVLNRIASISLSDAKNQARAYIWPMAIKGTLERPILGWGQENFNYIFNANYAPEMYGQEQWFDRAHSVFLDWFVASGFLGLIAYVALYVLSLIAIWKSALDMKTKSVLTGLIAAYAIHNLFVFDNLASYVMFFAVLGFANSFKEGKQIKLFGSNPMRADAVEYIVAPVVIVLILIVLYVFNVRLIQANTRLIAAITSCQGGVQGSYPDASLFEKALSVNVYAANQEIREQLLSCGSAVISSSQVPGPTKQAYFALAIGEIEKQIAATPKDARIYTLGGSFLNQVGQAEQAVKYLEVAHALSPTKQTIDFELATDYLNSTATVEKGVALLKSAYDLAPKYEQARLMYAVSLVVAGRESEARKTFDNDPVIFESAAMANVFASLKQFDKAIQIYEKMVIASPTDVNVKSQLAQLQYQAGHISAAVATLNSIAKDHPEYKSQIESAIKQIQK